MPEANLVAELRMKNSALKQELADVIAALQRALTDPPAQMSSPAGLLPIDSDGMRQAIDAWAKAEAECQRLRTKLVEIADDAVRYDDERALADELAAAIQSFDQYGSDWMEKANTALTNWEALRAR
jgi:hypothetical protein